MNEAEMEERITGLEEMLDDFERRYRSLSRQHDNLIKMYDVLKNRMGIFGWMALKFNALRTLF